MKKLDLIAPEDAGTLAGLFVERIRRSPGKIAYQAYDNQRNNWQGYTWQEVARQAAHWQQAMLNDGLLPGDRVAIMLKNCLEWVLFDLAATGLGLVTVPLYVNDRPENFTYILQSTEARLLLTDGLQQWRRIERLATGLLTSNGLSRCKRCAKRTVIRVCVTG